MTTSEHGTSGADKLPGTGLGQAETSSQPSDGQALLLGYSVSHLGAQLGSTTNEVIEVIPERARPLVRASGIGVFTATAVGGQVGEPEGVVGTRAAGHGHEASQRLAIPASCPTRAVYPRLDDTGRRLYGHRRLGTTRRTEGTRMLMQEPSAEDLAQVEAEWPLIAAEVALVDAEVAALTAGPAAVQWARRRVRRAEGRVAVEARAWAARSAALDARDSEQVQVMVTSDGVAA